MTNGGIAILSTCGLIAIALIGAWVELYKTRKTQQSTRADVTTVAHEMKPNHGGSLRDAVNTVSDQVSSLDNKLDGVVERLVRVETRQEYDVPRMRRATDG